MKKAYEKRPIDFIAHVETAVPRLMDETDDAEREHFKSAAAHQLARFMINESGKVSHKVMSDVPHHPDFAVHRAAVAILHPDELVELFTRIKALEEDNVTLRQMIHNAKD